MHSTHLSATQRSSCSNGAGARGARATLALVQPAPHHWHQRSSAQHQQHSNLVSATSQLCPSRRGSDESCSSVAARSAPTSVDPLSLNQGPYASGKTFIIHGPAELEQFTQQEPGKGKLTVLMAKASHCRPCKKFAATYHAFASQFSDCQLLEIVGDESKETRKMMVEMKVKVTPSFFLYRDGKLLNTLTGTKQQALRTAIMQQLKPGEACTPDLNTSEEDSDSDDE